MDLHKLCANDTTKGTMKRSTWSDTNYDFNLFVFNICAMAREYGGGELFGGCCGSGQQQSIVSRRAMC